MVPIRSWRLAIATSIPLMASFVILFVVISCQQKSFHHTCLVEPMTSPRTFVQSMLESMASSTKPQTTTLSPRIMYSPCGVSELSSGSSWGRITRSTVSLRTRLVTWSQDTSVPTNVRPSTVMMQIFSASIVSCLSRPLQVRCVLTVHVLVERHGGGRLPKRVCAWLQSFFLDRCTQGIEKRSSYAMRRKQI